MKHDLRVCKVGDYICTKEKGWEPIVEICENDVYPIRTKESSYTKYGYYTLDDKLPTAYEEPPKEWLKIVGEKPCRFKKGARVICRNYYKRYFSHNDGNKYFCFVEGRTEWAAEGRTMQWDKEDIKPWIEGEDK